MVHVICGLAYLVMVLFLAGSRALSTLVNPCHTYQLCQFVEINAMSLTAPQQAYTELWSKISEDKVCFGYGD
jgi:Cdc6-like AAA superfamily ATPase